MPGFRQGDVIRVPFPYTDRATRESRPALVVATGAMTQARGLLWVTMITSAVNKGWNGDLEITNLELAGLPAASVIRPAKIATIEAGDATSLGRISAALLKKVVARLSAEIGVEAS
jgi:mRNA interferase MazF